MVIASLTRKTSEHYTAVTDDGEEIKTTLGVITDLRLFEGKDLDSSQAEEFRALSSRAYALEKAIELVSQRQMSEKELKDKLLTKGQSEDNASYCTEWLKKNGFIDDMRYAGAVVRHYSSKGYGEGRIKSEFYKRGIPRDLWDEALEELSGDTDTIDSLLRKKLKDPSDKAQISKVSNMLYRRGFSWDEIKSALERLLEEY